MVGVVGRPLRSGRARGVRGRAHVRRSGRTVAAAAATHAGGLHWSFVRATGTGNDALGPSQCRRGARRSGDHGLPGRAANLRYRNRVGEVRHGRQRCAVESDLIAFGRPVAATLDGPYVNQNRTRNVERRPKDVLEAAPVVARNDAEIGNPQILEELARLGEVDDHAPDSPRQLEGRLTDDRQGLDDSVVGGLALHPGRRQLQRREVLAEGADGRADRHSVVVEDDQHLRLAMADVVERLEREAADQRRVADHDGDAFHRVARVARRGQALGD